MTDTRTTDQFTNRELAELLAGRLHISGGTVTIELVFHNGAFVRAHTHSGPIGSDDLDKLKGSTP